MLNKAILIGNLTRDPELRYTPSGQSVASFGVATNRRWKDSEGETRVETEFHEIVTWGKLAEICNQILKKGRKVYIEGRIQTRSWEAPDGSKKFRTEIVAQEMRALDGKPQEEDEKAEEILEEISEIPEKVVPTEEKKQAEKKPKEEGKKEEEEIDLDDIPF